MRPTHMLVHALISLQFLAGCWLSADAANAPQFHRRLQATDSGTSKMVYRVAEGLMFQDHSVIVNPKAELGGKYAKSLDACADTCDKSMRCNAFTYIKKATKVVLGGNSSSKFPARTCLLFLCANFETAKSNMGSHVRSGFLAGMQNGMCNSIALGEDRLDNFISQLSVAAAATDNLQNKDSGEANAAEAPTVAPQDVGLGRWMTDLWPAIKDKRFMDLWILGSHDTLTYDLSDETAGDSCDEGWMVYAGKVLSHLGSDINVIRKWAINHERSIYNQLENGVRYLDIRLHTDGNRIRGVHCILTARDIEAYAQEVRAWLDDKTKQGATELVIFSTNTLFGDGWNQGEIDKVVAIFDRVFGDFMVTKRVTGDVTLDQVLGGRSRVAVTLASQGSNMKFSVPSRMDMFANCGDGAWRPTTSVDNAVKFFRERALPSDNSGRLSPGDLCFMHDGLMTVDPDNILSNILGLRTHPYMIKTWIGDLNSRIVKLVYDEFLGKLPTGPQGCIIRADFVSPDVARAYALANLPAVPSLVEKNYGTCNAYFQLLGLYCKDTTNNCSPGYIMSSSYTGNSCKCKCYGSGGDNGCGTSAGSWCP